MKLRLHPEAHAEFDQATDYYAGIYPSLGVDFVAKIDAALDSIREAPERWPLWPGLPANAPVIRRMLVKRFPYGVAYEVFDEQIVILAICALRRKPLYWLERNADAVE